MNLHLDGEIAVHRGRTRLRGPESQARLGAPEELNRALPEEPTDDEAETVPQEATTED